MALIKTDSKLKKNVTKSVISKNKTGDSKAIVKKKSLQTSAKSSFSKKDKKPTKEPQSSCKLSTNSAMSLQKLTKE